MQYCNVLKNILNYFAMHNSNLILSFSDIQKIQDGISDKVSVSFQMVCRAVAGLIIGFVYGWKLALVILAVSPLLGASAVVMFKVS